MTEPSNIPRLASSAASDGAIVRRLWLVMLAAVISLFPFTVYSTFLVPIAASVRSGEAEVGMLRGLGGVAALVCGILLAPLIARWSKPHVMTFSLLLLSGASLIGTVGTFSALVVFCLGIGVATALLTPALLHTAAHTYSAPADSGRAATLVTATQSLAAVLAGPVIGALAWWNDWHGALWITSALAAALAMGFIRSRRTSTPRSDSVGYLDSFRRLRGRIDLCALIGIATLRTASFMGYLAFLAAAYHETFSLDAVVFTLVWSLSGVSFFAGNYLAGRWAREPAATGGHRHRVLLLTGLAVALLAVTIVFTTDLLLVALFATVLMGFGHAIVAAQVTTLIAHRGGRLTTVAYSVNAAGMSLGVFAGSVIGGIGLSLGGFAGLSVALAIPTLLAVALVPPATSHRQQACGAALSAGR